LKYIVSLLNLPAKKIKTVFKNSDIVFFIFSSLYGFIVFRVSG